jgi:hypothetical protein
MSYNHLRPEERYYIDIELKKGTSQNKMAKSLGRSQGSISRELARNTGQRGYRNNKPKCPSCANQTPTQVYHHPSCTGLYRCLKGARYVFLKNTQNLTKKQQQKKQTLELIFSVA